MKFWTNRALCPIDWHWEEHLTIHSRKFNIMTLKKCALPSGSGAISVAITEMNRKIQEDVNEYFQWIWRTFYIYYYTKRCQLGKICFSFLWKAPFTHLFMEIWFDFYLLRKQFWWNHNKKNLEQKTGVGMNCWCVIVEYNLEISFQQPTTDPSHWYRQIDRSTHWRHLFKP